jgi:23S rRNA pseudouridine2605 synthase
MAGFKRSRSTATSPRRKGAKPTALRGRARRSRGGESNSNDANGDADGSHVRVQKLLAAAGIGSRRKCEELITAGRVTIDGKVVTELGTKVDPESADVRVDLEPLPRSHHVYYMVNKPIGVVTTNSDPDGRPRVVDLAPQGQRLFAVGRLDATSEGLILVTNDGELANRLAHPRYGVEKTYQVQVAGLPTPEVLQKLRRGVHLAEGFAHAKRIWVKSHHKQSTILEMVLDEGKNREVRRLLAQVGHKVLHLRRTAFGSLRLGDLPIGACRALRREELRMLKSGATGQGSGSRDQRTGDGDQEPGNEDQGSTADSPLSPGGRGLAARSARLSSPKSAERAGGEVEAPRPGRNKAAVGRRKQFHLRQLERGKRAGGGSKKPLRQPTGRRNGARQEPRR